MYRREAAPECENCPCPECRARLTAVLHVTQTLYKKSSAVHAGEALSNCCANACSLLTHASVQIWPVMAVAGTQAVSGGTAGVSVQIAPHQQSVAGQAPVPSRPNQTDVRRVGHFACCRRALVL